MKLFGRSLAFLAILLLAGCNDRGSEVVVQYTVTVEDHETTPYQFPPGVYYSYTFPESQSYEFDVDAIFQQASGLGVHIEDAWYKNYNTECAPPGSNIAMPAIVRAGFVVRVDRPSTALRMLRFVETSTPDLDWCAYRVRHYHFQP